MKLKSVFRYNQVGQVNSVALIREILKTECRVPDLGGVSICGPISGLPPVSEGTHLQPPSV